MDAKKWSKEYIQFMIRVFVDLNFVTYDEGVLSLNPSPTKQDLSSSRTYQHRVNRATIEKTLYYSTYDELKQWFEKSRSEEHTSELQSRFDLVCRLLLE